MATVIHTNNNKYYKSDNYIILILARICLTEQSYPQREPNFYQSHLSISVTSVTILFTLFSTKKQYYFIYSVILAKTIN